MSKQRALNSPLGHEQSDISTKPDILYTDAMLNKLGRNTKIMNMQTDDCIRCTLMVCIIELSTTSSTILLSQYLQMCMWYVNHMMSL